MPRRIWIPATLAIALLLSPGCARQPEGSGEQGEIDRLPLGKVAGKTFTVADLKSKIRYQYGNLGAEGPTAATLNEQRGIYRDAIDQLCLVRLGESKGYDRDPAFQETYELSRRWILTDRTVQREVRERAIPTDEEIEAEYRDHAADYTVPTRVQIAHVMSRTKEQADAVRRRLLAGEAIGDLARELSIDAPSKGSGGVLGWISATSGAGHLGIYTQINEAVIHLQTGEVSLPVAIPDKGWSVFFVLDRVEEGPRPLDAPLREAISKKLQTKKHNDLYASLLDRLRKEYGAEFYDENFDRYARSLLSEEELFKNAQREKDPLGRMGSYEEILRRFPESPHAAQALFMIGFTQADSRKDFKAARAAFESFLHKHPEHELAASARWMLEHMESPDPDPASMMEIRRQASGR